MEGDIITMQEIFVFQQTGYSVERTVRRATSWRPACGPRFQDRLHAFGIEPAGRSVRSEPSILMRR